MSHFTVLVIGNNAEEQLAPFDENDRQEFEDITEEYKKRYETDKTTAAIFADGRIVSIYDDSLEKYRQWDSEKSRKVLSLPADARQEEVLCSAIFKTFDSYMKDYCGYEKKNGRYGYYHNPKAKWDWYQLGGRWTGYFKLKTNNVKHKTLSDLEIRGLALKYGVSKLTISSYAEAIAQGYRAQEKFEQGNVIRGGYDLSQEIKALITPEYANAKVGTSGLMTDMPKAGYVDSAKIKDIDFDAMIEEAALEAKSRYEMVEKLLGGSIPKLDMSWKEIIADDGPYSHLNIDEKRDLFWNQPAQLKLKEIQANAKNLDLTQDEKDTLMWLELERYQGTKDEYIEQAKAKAIPTFAVIKDGEWYQKGDMGWFGVVTNGKEQEQWNSEFNKLIDSLDGETVVSVYDCHI